MSRGLGELAWAARADAHFAASAAQALPTILYSWALRCGRGARNTLAEAEQARALRQSGPCPWWSRQPAAAASGWPGPCSMSARASSGCSTATTTTTTRAGWGCSARFSEVERCRGASQLAARQGMTWWRAVLLRSGGIDGQIYLREMHKHAANS